MDFNTSRGAGLLRAYRDGQLQIDGLVASANVIGLSSDEVVCLLENAAESEPSTTRSGKLSSLLIRSCVGGQLTLDEVVAYAVGLGVENYEIVHLIHQVGCATEGTAA